MFILEYLVKVLIRLFYRMKFRHLDRLQLEGRTIIMPNHVSFLDALFLALYLPRNVVFVVNTEIARRLKQLIRFRRHITIDPLNPYSVRQLINAVKEEIPLVIFPEGRITTTNGLMKIYDGIGYIALRTQATVYPVGIAGLEYSKLSRLQGKVRTRWFPPVTLCVGEPFTIPPSPGKPMRLQKTEASQRILKAMQNVVYQSRQKTNINLFNELIDAGRSYGMGTEIAEDIGQTITYRKLLIGSYVLSRKLKWQLTGDSRVGVLLPSSIGHAVTLFALFKNNVTPAILNFTLGPQSLLDCLDTAEIKTILTSRLFIDKGKLQPLIDELGKRVRILYLEDIKNTVGLGDKLAGFFAHFFRRHAARKDDSLILFTSGSESKPKGVVLGHDQLMANIQQAECVIDFTAKDKILNALPMFHSFGLTAGTLLPLLCGMPVFLYPSPLHYKIIPELIYDRNATILFGTSTFLLGYGKHAHPYDFYSLRYVFAGAEKLREETRQMWMDKFGIRIFEGYGTTETAPILSLNTPLLNKKGSVGQLLPGLEFRVEPVEGIERGGNLWVKGPNVMKGYLIHGKGFIPAGEWYDCGDLVEVDDQGYVTILSRLKRFAKVAGEMISLNLVEELAEKCFGTSGFAAVNIPDGRRGESIILYTTNQEADRPPLREFIQQAGQSPLMLPTALRYLDKLPLLGSGKIDYVTLRELALQNAR